MRALLLFLIVGNSLSAVTLSPSLSGKGDQVLMVSQHTYEISSPDETPVLETCSLGPCIALALWDPKTHIGALAHFDAGTAVSPSVETLAKAFSETLAPKVFLAGGLLGWSDELQESLYTSLRQAGLAISAQKGIYPRESNFKCARLTLRDGSLEVSDDPGIGWMKVARYDLFQPLTRTRDTKLYEGGPAR